MKILGIETSCDETSAAVVEDNRALSNIVSSQSVHIQFGGVVPELASRAHLRKIVPVVEQALEQAGSKFAEIDGFSVTHGPGLIGALLVGVNYVKGLSLAFQKPFIGVNHIEGHVYSNFLDNAEIVFPVLNLIVSGGHTQLVIMADHLKYCIIGKTRDDAVGEAFDKVAKLLGLPYPGGPQIDKLAENGNDEYTKFPIGLAKEKTFDFSYSGLKTAVLNFTKSHSPQDLQTILPDVCASFQHAAVGALVKRTIEAARTYQIRQIAVSGGVAANSLLRKKLKQEAAQFHLKVYFPQHQYCSDNAAMIARAGLERLKRGYFSDINLNSYPSLLLGEERSCG